MKNARMIAAALVLCMACGCTAAVNQPVDVSNQRNVIAYSTEKAVHTLLPENQQKLTLYRNAAKDLNSYDTISQMLSSDGAYIGKENFVRLGSEILFLQTGLNSYDSNGLAADYVLYSVKDGKEPVEIDRDVQALTCSSDSSLYYEKTVDGVMRQYRYANGEISLVGEEWGGDLAMVTHCSADDSVQAYVTVTLTEDGGYTASNGYIHDGKQYTFENPYAEAYFLSPDGKHLYTIEMADEYGRSINLNYLSVETGEFVRAAEGVSEALFYENSGSMVCVAEILLDDGVMNPVGSLYYFDASTKTGTKLADDVVTVIESEEKSYPWLNENAGEMIVLELSSFSSFSEPVKEGQFHYINSSGTFCAVDLNGNNVEVFPEFYLPEGYSIGEGLYYLAEMDGAFYWAKGNQVYRYEAGSMSAAQSVALEDEMSKKIESGMEIGYVLCKDGAVLEQSGSTLNVKPFDSASFTAYDGTEPIFVMGLDESGETVYFLQGMNLIGKKLFADDKAFLVAENVYDAIVVDCGIYALCNYGEQGGELYYIDYSGKNAKLMDSGVLSLSDTMIMK